MWLTRYFDSHAAAVECDTMLQLVFRDCLYMNTEYSWWLTCISDNQPTFGARVKCCLIHMALFSTRNFSYRVHKQQFVLKRRTHLVHCTYLPHYFVYTLDAFKYRHAYCAYGDQTRSFIFGKTSLGVSAQNLTAFIIVYFVTDTLDL